MEIEGKVLAYGIVIALVLLLVLTTFGIIKFNFRSSGNAVSSNADYSNVPEKCRPPAGQDIAVWKQHLSHHAETQECLKYFN